MIQHLIFWLIGSKQYHGGTNFDHSSGGPFITTTYDYDAPIDEYGMDLMIFSNLY